MRHVSLFCTLVFLLAGCGGNRLRHETAQCAVDAHQGAVQWYAANASNTRSGSIVLTKFIKGETTLEIWRGCGTSGNTVMPLKVSSPMSLSVSLRGRYAMARGSAPGIELLDLESGESLAYFPDCHGPGVFSSNARFALIPCRNSAIQLYDIVARKLSAEALFDPEDSVYALATDRKFTRLAIGSGAGKITLLDILEAPNTVELRNPRTIDKGEGDWVSALKFSDSSQELYSVSRNGRLDVWSVNSGERTHTWKTNLNWVGSVTFFKQATRVVVFGTLAPSGLADPAAVVIDTATGKQRSLKTEQNYLWGAYIPGSDELLVGGFWTVPRIERNASVVP